MIPISGFKQITLSQDLQQFDPNRSLWRYINYTKFRSLLKDSALYFASPHQFDDRFEGFPTKIKYIGVDFDIMGKVHMKTVLEG